MSNALPYEDLGQLVRGRMFYQKAVLAPSCRSDGWSAYVVYRDHIVKRDPWTIYEVNLQTQQVTPFEGQMCDTWCLQAMPDGCVYTFPEMVPETAYDQRSLERKSYVARVNTRLGKLEMFGPGSPDGWNYCMSWGPDRAVYIGGWRRHHAMRFDSDTGQFVDYGVQGPECEGGIYNIAADEQYVYTTMGASPFCLVACHKQSREQSMLLELQWPNRAKFVHRGGDIFVKTESVREAGAQEKITELDSYQLENARLTPIDVISDDTERTPVSPGGIVQPQILDESPACRADGSAVLWYRPHGGKWTSVGFEAGPSASHLFRLGSFADGQIVGSSEDPYHVFTIDSSTGRKAVAGPVPYVTHVYGFAECLGKVYFAGYAHAPVFEWDPDRPWTYQPPSADAPAPDASAIDANPRLVTRVPQQHRAYRIMAAADDRLYMPCSANVRLMNGGLLGWYDPRTGQTGGQRDGFEMHRGHDCSLAADGRYVVTSAVPWPHHITGESTRVVIYDTQSQRVTAKLVPEKWLEDACLVCEWKPGIVVGRVDVNERSADGPYEAAFFVVDVAAAAVAMGPHMQGKHSGKLIRLPDGRIGSMLGQTVLAIDPHRWRVQEVGTLPANPRDWMMLGDDLVFIHDTNVCLVRDFLV